MEGLLKGELFEQPSKRAKLIIGAEAVGQ